MTIMDAIKKGMIELKNSNIESPKLKSRLLMQYVLNQTRQYIIVNDLNQISKEDEERYFVGISKLRADVPLEHITHQREFMKLNLNETNIKQYIVSILLKLDFLFLFILD